MEKETFLVIDGHSLIFRAVHSPGRVLRSPSGEPTRGTYIFCQKLFETVARLKPSYAIMAMDERRSQTFRRKMYPPYKANRPSHDQDDPSIPIQLKRIEQLVQALGIPTLMAPGFEADDVIATLASYCASPDVEVVVCTSDKDMHQIVTDDVVLHNVFDLTFDTVETVKARWGVDDPSQVLEIQNLMGDSTDNIPGVRGIGIAGAKKLISEHKDVDAVVLAAEKGKLKPSATKAILDTDLDLQRKLVALRTDVPLDIRTSDLEFDGFTMNRARPLFLELGFSEWL